MSKERRQEGKKSGREKKERKRSNFPKGSSYEEEKQLNLLKDETTKRKS